MITLQTQLIQPHPDRGQILILVTLSLTVLLGIAALSVDASYMYDKRNRLHAAADAAAKAGAIEVLRNPGITLASLKNFADQQVALHGFTAAACHATVGASVCITYPPGAGPFRGIGGYVEAIITEQTSTFFGFLLGVANLSPTARAVAGPSPSPDCIVILSSPSSSSIRLSSASVNAPGCTIEDGGNLTLVGGATITASSVTVAVGPCDVSVANCSSGAAAPSDPLAGLPPLTDTCATTYTIPPDSPIIPQGTYCGIGVTGNNNTVTMNGVYLITGTGGLSVIGNNNRLIGTGGVMIYNGGSGAISIDPTTYVNLSAPTTGAYTGVVLIQPASNTQSATIAGSAGSFWSGALYLPSANVTFTGNATGTSDCSLVVAQAITMVSGGTLNEARTCAAYGGSPLLTTSLAE